MDDAIDDHQAAKDVADDQAEKEEKEVVGLLADLLESDEEEACMLKDTEDFTNFVLLLKNLKKLPVKQGHHLNILLRKLLKSQGIYVYISYA